MCPSSKSHVPVFSQVLIEVTHSHSRTRYPWNPATCFTSEKARNSPWVVSGLLSTNPSLATLRTSKVCRARVAYLILLALLAQGHTSLCTDLETPTWGRKSSYRYISLKHVSMLSWRISMSNWYFSKFEILLLEHMWVKFQCCHVLQARYSFGSTATENRINESIHKDYILIRVNM